MFRTICALTMPDGDYPARTSRLELLRRVLDGTLYDVLPYEFHEERTPDGQYIPLRNRRPSVQYKLPKLIVEDSVALLFSDGHFPTFDSPLASTRDALAAITRDSALNATLIEAALRGSVGSVALWLRILAGRVFVQVVETLYLTPVWDRVEPDSLLVVQERYKASGTELIAQGFDLPDKEAIYWFTRKWDREYEYWFHPQLVGTLSAPILDDIRSVKHGLGFVPFVWIRNLPGGNGIDGSCTFSAAIDISIEIDYQLSQAGRGLKYSSDPTLLIKEPAGQSGAMVRGAANALVVSEKGDAKLLEIGGTASQAVIDYVRTLREFALETVHGNRVDSSRLSTPASGRALELMNQGLICLADSLRTSYGQCGLLPLARMILRASQVYPLRAEGTKLPALDVNSPISLRWPSWYPADSADRQRDAETIKGLVSAGQLSQETGLRILASSYDIEDVPAELQRIKGEERV